MIRIILLFLSSTVIFINCNTNNPAVNSQNNGESNLLSASMNERRAAHTATLLANGKVLIAGGLQEDGKGRELAINNVEIFDPAQNDFRNAGTMIDKRNTHETVLLNNGKVLIIGGWGETGLLSSVEIYNPETGNFSAAGNMNYARSGFTATRLNDDKVLITGGVNRAGSFILETEFYDPVSNTFIKGDKLNAGRAAHTAEKLKNGKVLLIGGGYNKNITSSVEIYDPVTGKFTVTGNMAKSRYKHDSVLLEDGNVLVIGGSDENDWNGKYRSAEVYKSNEGKFYKVNDMNNERFKLSGASVLLKNGKVLIAGGNSKLEIYDPQLMSFEAAGNINNPYYYAAATLLKDGRVLISGGYDNSIAATSNAFIYGY